MRERAVGPIDENHRTREASQHRPRQGRIHAASFSMQVGIAQQLVHGLDVVHRATFLLPVKFRRRPRRPRRGRARGKGQHEPLNKTSGPEQRPKQWRASGIVARPSVGRHRKALSSSGQTVPGRECTVSVRWGVLPLPWKTHAVGTEPDRRRPRSTRRRRAGVSAGVKLPKRGSLFHTE